MFSLKPHFIFFYLFLFSFPFNIRKVFLSEHSYYTGHLIEDVTYFLNLSDIFLILAIVFGTIHIIRNNPQVVFFNFLKKNKLVFWLLGTIIIWSFLGVLYAKSPSLVLFGTLKAVEFSFLFGFIAYFLIDSSKIFFSLKIIALGGFIQSIIAVVQYAGQTSLGLKILGESIIGKDLPGVAKLVVDGEKVIRPYGTFGHPNILGGFLVFSLSASLILYLLKEKKSINIFYLLFAGLLAIMFFDHYLITNQQGQIILWLVLALVFTVLSSPFEKTRPFGGTTAERWILLFIILQFIALVLTYSRTAWLAFGVVAAGVSLLLFKKDIWSRWLKILIMLLILLISLFAFLPLGSRIGSSFDVNSQAVGDRVLGVQTAFNIIKKHPLVGVGNKNYIINIDNYGISRLDYWQYQPVHNSYLLIWSESGFIGIGLFIVFTAFVITHEFFSRPTRHDQK